MMKQNQLVLIILTMSNNFCLFLFFLKNLISAIKPITKEIKEYRRCVDEFSKTVITIIMPNLIKSIKKVCVTNTECKLLFYIGVFHCCWIYQQFRTLFRIIILKCSPKFIATKIKVNLLLNVTYSYNNEHEMCNQRSAGGL